MKKAARALTGKRKRRKRTKKKKKKENSDDDSDDSDADDPNKKCLDPPIKLNILDGATTKNMVKPIRIMMETWELEEKLNPVRRHTRPSRLFFGNKPYYVFFRLHQFLYERMSTAKSLTGKKHGRSSGKSKSLPITPEGRYKNFKQMMYQLLDGEMDSSRFEDECRILLGASSYVLFTIDKLVSQVVQQVQSILQNPICMQLLSLYQYEYCRSRSSATPVPEMSSIVGDSPMFPPSLTVEGTADEQQTLERSAELARIYHSNCASLLGDDSCCQIEYFEDNNALGIGMIDGFMATEPKSITAVCTEYLDGLLNNSPRIPAVPPFLIRNFKKFMNPSPGKEGVVKEEKKGRGRRPLPRSGKRVLPGDRAADHDSGYRIVCHYGLEAQICATTFKLNFREDTCDYFIRHRYPNPTRQLPTLPKLEARESKEEESEKSTKEEKEEDNKMEEDGEKEEELTEAELMKMWRESAEQRKQDDSRRLERQKTKFAIWYAKAFSELDVERVQDDKDKDKDKDSEDGEAAAAAALGGEKKDFSSDDDDEEDEKSPGMVKKEEMKD